MTLSRTLCLFLSLLFLPAAGGVELERMVAAEGAVGYFADLALGENGEILIADSKDGGIVRFDGQSFDRVESRVSRPGGIAHVGGGQLALTDTSNSEVLLYTATGKVRERFADSGSSDGELDTPASVAAGPSGRLYVADHGNDRVSIFSRDGVFLHHLGDHRAPQLSSPRVVKIDSAENVYVLEQGGGGRITVLDHRGALLARLDGEWLEQVVGESIQPKTIAVDQAGVLFVGDGNRGRVYQIDWRNRRRITAFGSRGSGQGRYRQMSALLSLPDSRLLVADSGNRRIDIYRLDDHQQAGQPAPQISGIPVAARTAVACSAMHRYNASSLLCARKKASSLHVDIASDRRTATRFTGNAPQAVFQDGTGTLLLDGNALVSLNAEGKLQFEVGEQGAADGQFDNPTDVFATQDHIYVADTGNRRVQIFSRDGVVLSKLDLDTTGRPIFKEPIAVVLADSGDIYVADRGLKQVLVFDAEHKFRRSIDGPYRQQFTDLYDLDLDRDGQLYVLAATQQNDAFVAVFSEFHNRFNFGSGGDHGFAIGDPRSISVTGDLHIEVSVHDADRDALLRFEFAQVPPRVRAVRAIGNRRSTAVEWTASGTRTVTGYLVYSAEQRNGPYQLREALPADQTRWQLDHEGRDAPLYYRVSAVSADGLEGESSTPARDLFQLAYRAYAQGEFTEATRYFRDASRNAPEQAEPLRYLGQSLMKMGESRRAEQAFQRLAEVEGHEEEALNLRIQALASAGRELEAKALIDEAVSRDSASVDTLRICGELSLSLEDAISAVTCLEQGLSRAPENVELHLLLGQAYLALDIKQQGFAEIDRATALASNEASIWFRSARIYDANGKPKQAIARLEKALDRQPDFRKAQLELARHYLALERYDRVNNLAVKLAATPETAAEGHYLMGRVAMRKNDMPRALLALTRATQAAPDNADAWLAIADVNAAMGRPQQLVEALRSALAAAPEDFSVNLRLGRRLLERDEAGAALRPLRTAVKLQPEATEARLLLAQALEKTGSHTESLRHALIAGRTADSGNAPLILAARLYHQQGKNTRALKQLDKAIEREPANAALYTLRGKILADSGMQQRAKEALEKAAALAPTDAEPLIALASLHRQRRAYPLVIEALERLLALEDSEYHQALLDEAVAEQKQANGAGAGSPQLVLRDLHFEPIFSATHQQYSDTPLGQVTIANIGNEEFANLQVAFRIREYMDFDSTVAIDRLGAGESRIVPLKATFNHQILSIEEDTGVQAEVSLLFERDRKPQRTAVTRALTLYGKNAILWGRRNMIGAFVTPRDPLLRDYVRETVQRLKPADSKANDKLVTAMTLFESLSAHGLRYVEDPASPYSIVSNDRVDSVQFPRETLRLKVGDCDDLSVLYAAALAQLGIDSAFVYLPGHLLMMFDTGLASSDADRLTIEEDLLVTHDDRIWVPVETTMISTGFVQAWAEGARRYHESLRSGVLSLLELNEAWREFSPAPLSKAKEPIVASLDPELVQSVDQAHRLLLEMAAARLVKPYEAMAQRAPEDDSVRMQIAIHYARFGLIERADAIFDELLERSPGNGAVHNNRGSMHLSRRDYESALDAYQRAEQLDPRDPGIKVNLALTYYHLGNHSLAREKFEEAVSLRDTVRARYAQLAKLLGL